MNPATCLGPLGRPASGARRPRGGRSRGRSSNAKAGRTRPVLAFHKRRSEGGSATLWTLGVATLVIIAGYTATGLAAVVSASHRADAAADLAALSALDRGCEGARAIALAHGARLSLCRFERAPDPPEYPSPWARESVEVEVEVRLRPLFDHRLVVRSQARAGYTATGL